MLAYHELITVRQQGRDRFCEARLDQLSEVSMWVDQYKQHWEFPNNKRV